MDTQTRRQRLSAALETQFGHCNHAADAFAGWAKEINYDRSDYLLRQMQSLMKVSVQLAGAIARLDRAAASAQQPSAIAPENSENRGSIPQ